MLFRGLMGGIIEDDNAWSATNGEGIFKSNKDLDLACIGEVYCSCFHFIPF